MILNYTKISPLLSGSMLVSSTGVNHTALLTELTYIFQVSVRYFDIQFTKNIIAENKRLSSFPQSPNLYLRKRNNYC